MSPLPVIMQKVLPLHTPYQPEKQENDMIIEQSTEFTNRWTQFRGAYIEADVVNAPTSPALWQEIQDFCATLRSRYTTDTIKQQSGIAATRQAYKACGKDPSRYRPASEQLARRVLQGKDLYSVDTLVDLGNLVSLFSGYPTGLLDQDRVVGNVSLGVGHAGEPYEGIGRGVLNIEGLPVYRDAEGPIASPTSDSTRTMLSADTRHLLFIINGYDGDEAQIERAVAYALDLIKRYAQSKNERVARF